METVYSRGGAGNSKLVGFSSNREAKLTLQDAIFDNQSLAMLTGNALVEGAKTIDFNEIITVNTNAATLTKTPVGSLTSVYIVNPDGTNGTELDLTAGTLATGEYDITGKDMDFFAGDIPNGGKVRVYYKVSTDPTAKTLKVTSDAFGGTFKVTLNVLVRDEFTKKDYEAIITVPNAKFEDNFNFSLRNRAS